MLRSEITAAALSMVGSPFHAQGRLPGIGLDCIGVIVCVARALNIPHTDVTAYPMRPNGMLMPILDTKLVRVRREPGASPVSLAMPKSRTLTKSFSRPREMR
mgnify:CR=1 FL=1